MPTSAGLTPTIAAVEIVREWDDTPDTSYLDQDGFEDRREALRRGEFAYVGVFARARISFATEQGGSAGAFNVDSPGLWGIESDSGEDYFAEIAGEELDTLADMLGALGIADAAAAIESAR